MDGLQRRKKRDGGWKGDKPRSFVEHLIIHQSTTCVSLPSKEHIITCPERVAPLVSECSELPMADTQRRGVLRRMSVVVAEAGGKGSKR